MDVMKIKAIPSIGSKKNKKGSIVSSLPQDLLVEVAMQVVSKSSTPMKDVKSLRVTCKKFYRASKDRLVGRSMSVSKESKMYWTEKDDYFELLRHCAESGNLDAYFIFGFEKICNLDMRTQGLEDLKRAVDGGHFAAAYFMGIVLLLEGDTQSDAMEILNKVAFGNLFCDSREVTQCTRSGNSMVDRCRREVTEIARRSWKRWMVEARLPCEHPLCGRIIKAKNINYWMKNDQLPKTYCSQICCWTDECHRFIENI